MSVAQQESNSALAGDVDTGIERIVKLAIMAVGGQGGGVLTQWITELARNNGYAVQATSVAGVAQRTGSTIYYVEMTPDTGRQPVFSLMPSAADVDILIAAELMEAGRAILRGFVTPDRTTLIASSHRNLAVSEKIVPGDGIARADKIMAAADSAARRSILFDMERIANDCGTVISASLFGALAGSQALPFDRERFEETIRASGRGVDASLEAFRQAWEASRDEHSATDTGSTATNSLGGDHVEGPDRLLREWRALIDRAGKFPEPVRDLVHHGLRKVVDFQDTGYGGEYLDRLEQVLAAERHHGPDPGEFALTLAAAKHVANAMAYDDVIRVADLKTRASRFTRIHREIGIDDRQRLHITEFMHPRAQELCSMMPRRLGRFVQQRPRLFASLDRVVNRGRRLRTDSIFWFLVLYLLGGLRRYRRGMLRHEVEQTHLNAWLEQALSCAAGDYDLAVELIHHRRLIKGYGDTHGRGQYRFERVMAASLLLEGRPGAATKARRLREAALSDPNDKALDQTI